LKILNHPIPSRKKDNLPQIEVQHNSTVKKEADFTPEKQFPNEKLKTWRFQKQVVRLAITIHWLTDCHFYTSVVNNRNKTKNFTGRRENTQSSSANIRVSQISPLR
jgi:hypothetical protein